MQEHGYWVGCATSVEASIEGQQLLAREIAHEVQRLWRRMRRWINSGMLGAMMDRMRAAQRQ